MIELIAVLAVGLIIGAVFMWAYLSKEPPMPVRDKKTGKWRNPENGQWVKRG